MDSRIGEFCTKVDMEIDRILWKIERDRGDEFWKVAGVVSLYGILEGLKRAKEAGHLQCSCCSCVLRYGGLVTPVGIFCRRCLTEFMRYLFEGTRWRCLIESTARSFIEERRSKRARLRKLDEREVLDLEKIREKLDCEIGLVSLELDSVKGSPGWENYSCGMMGIIEGLNRVKVITLGL